MSKSTFVIAMIVLTAALITILLVGCATNNKRALLEKEYPDCFVQTDLEIICVNPMTGFGAGVERVKNK